MPQVLCLTPLDVDSMVIHGVGSNVAPLPSLSMSKYVGLAKQNPIVINVDRGNSTER